VELGIGWPTVRPRCTAAVFGKYGRKSESDCQQRGEEKHDRAVCLICEVVRIYSMDPAWVLQTVCSDVAAGLLGNTPYTSDRPFSAGGLSSNEREVVDPYSDAAIVISWSSLNGPLQFSPRN